MHRSAPSGASEAGLNEHDEVAEAVKTHPARRVASWVFWLLVAGLVALAVALVGVPLASGGKALIVKSGSMVPMLPVGSAVVIDSKPVGEITAGDVITFADTDAGGRLVTHRVVGVEPAADGPHFITKGDANEDPDRGFVKAEQVQGVYWYKIPFVGTAMDFLTSTAGMLYGAAALLLIFTGHLLIPKTSPKRKSSNE